MTSTIVNFSSLNVNGIKCKAKRDRVIEWIKTQRCSICFLQETHFNNDIENDIKQFTDYDIFCSHGTTASRGVAILLQKSLNYRLSDYYTDVKGRIVLVNVEIDDNIFSFLCLYVKFNQCANSKCTH